MAGWWPGITDGGLVARYTDGGLVAGYFWRHPLINTWRMSTALVLVLDTKKLNDFLQKDT